MSLPSCDAGGAAIRNRQNSDEKNGSVPKSCQLLIYIDVGIRKYLQLKAHESKKIKMFVPSGDIITNANNLDSIQCDNKMSVKIRRCIEKSLPLLPAQTDYILSYEQRVNDAGDVIAENIKYHHNGVAVNSNKLRTVDDGADFYKTLIGALHSLSFLAIYVRPSLSYPPHQHLTNTKLQVEAVNPMDCKSYTMLSFYRFQHVSDTLSFLRQLENIWKPLMVLGRVYIAEEGVNAQLAIPTNVLNHFYAACESLPFFDNQYFNPDHNVSREEFASLQPFKSLSIRIRSQVLADGFDESLDWNVNGKEVAPGQWHRDIDNQSAVILDCRNKYESDVGKFDGAIPLGTNYFRNSWQALDNILKDTPKDAPIMTYCTGGIRCVKINAYLEQKKGFTNVSRLQGGIIAYTRELEQQNQDEKSRPDEVPLPSDGHYLYRDVQESKFKGVNYVFDKRMCSRITSDILSECELCKAPSDMFVNCSNSNCQVTSNQYPVRFWLFNGSKSHF